MSDKPKKLSGGRKIRVKPGPLMYPLPVVMVTAGDMKEKNIITIAWTGIVNTDPPMLYISVRKQRHTYAMLKEHMSFVVNLVTEELAKATDFCGVRSGSRVDKFEMTGLTPIPASVVSAPMIDESPVSLECEVREIRELPTHDMFIAEVVAVHIDEDMIDENGMYDFSKMRLVAFNHGAYYKVGRKEIGRFGYSVMRPRTLKRKRREDAEAKRAKAGDPGKHARGKKGPRKKAKNKNGARGRSRGGKGSGAGRKGRS
jgi:flavin reductase (DIM6/NTAB) family NADH-FMN oxidoreductase RutF